MSSMHVLMYVHLNVCRHTSMSVCLCVTVSDMHESPCIYVYACLHVNMYVYM